MGRSSVRRRRRLLTTEGPVTLSDLEKLWLLRLLVPLRGHKSFVGERDFENDELALALGLDEWLENPKSHDPAAIRTQLRQMHQRAERRARTARNSGSIRDNIAHLARLVGLSDTDCRIIEFAVTSDLNSLLGMTADFVGEITVSQTYRVLAVVLDLPEIDIRAALAPNGLLANSGLVTMNREGADYLAGKLELISSTFAENITDLDASDPVILLRDSVIPGTAPQLALQDFSHLSRQLTVLVPYLCHALTTGKKGVNVLLYGPPGTGKTELSRILAREANGELFEVASEFEVSSEDEERNPTSSEARLRAFRAGQCFFAQRENLLLLFDEVEDIFGDGDIFSSYHKAAASRKAWINRMLESNPVPTVWVANSTRGLDPAYIRRFDMAIEVPVPPKRQRERMIREVAEGMLPDDMVRRLAAHERIAPAVIARAVAVLRSVAAEIPAHDLPKAVEEMVNGTLKAQGHRSIQGNDPERLPTTYDPAFVRVDADLAAIADGLSGTKAGRICLYGPPGTGKTAFARWLADRLDLPLHVKKGSDLISKWVGGTEQNIARAFHEAAQDGALLLIDEVDGFLRDRRQAVRSWEVTEVNEMLTQMESFAGLFIASTNLMDGLDQAALRRFDLKLGFGYLKAEQAWQLFVRQCAALSLPAPSSALRKSLGSLTVLTPGDFAAIARQHRFRPLHSPQALFAALEQECAVKEDGQRKSIGFA